MSPLEPTPLHGDEAQLYRDLSHRLLCTVRGSVTAPDDVIEDACSFAWLQLLRHQPRRDTAFSWLTKVAIREAWRLAQRERRDAHVELMAEDDERLHDPVDTDLQVRAHDALEALAGLPARQRAYLWMLIAGYSYNEIATLNSTSRTAVNKRLVSARSALRTHAQH